MRGAVICLPAAAIGVVVLLLTVPVIQGQDGWGVTYSSTKICALKGSTVEMSCTYRYPSTVKRVQNRFWFTKKSNGLYTDLRKDPEYSGRVQYNCVNNNCILRITDLRESDSTEYKFRFITNESGGRYFGSPGVTLSVTDLQVRVDRSHVFPSELWARLKCHSSCLLPVRLHYVWYKNGRIIQGETSAFYSDSITSTDSFSCAVEGHENFRSPPLYPMRVPYVSPSGEIVEGSSVTLTCNSDANPAVKYTWYKENGNADRQPLSKEPQLHFSSIQSSDSGEYYCTAENEPWMRTSEYIFIGVKYAPKLPSVSVSPSAEIVEGSSVTLTCSSDANPAANYTWYKEKQKLLRGHTGIYHFSSISSEDRGNYSCKSENKYGEIMSSSVSVDVQYAPKLPSVSVSPSAEIVEGSSVTLTCSSDANPAANYNWYKENGDSPKASGQIFTITDFKTEHRGNYSCEVQNRRGRNETTVHLTVVSGSRKSAAGTKTVFLLAIISLSVFLWIRKKRASRESTEAEERTDDREQGQPEGQDDLNYASVHFSNNQAVKLSSNIRPAQPRRHVVQQDVEYTAVRFNSAITAPRARGQGAAEDPAVLYSTVNKTR